MYISDKKFLFYFIPIFLISLSLITYVPSFSYSGIEISGIGLTNPKVFSNEKTTIIITYDRTAGVSFKDLYLGLFMDGKLYQTFPLEAGGGRGANVGPYPVATAHAETGLWKYPGGKITFTACIYYQNVPSILVENESCKSLNYVNPYQRVPINNDVISFNQPSSSYISSDTSLKIEKITFQLPKELSEYILTYFVDQIDEMIIDRNDNLIISLLDGNCYETDNGRDCLSIMKFDINEKSLKKIFTFVDGLSLHQITLDNQGNVYALTSYDVLKYDVEGNLIEKWGLREHRPDVTYTPQLARVHYDSIVVDSSGHIYLKDWFIGAIDVFDSNMNYISTLKRFSTIGANIALSGRERIFDFNPGERIHIDSKDRIYSTSICLSGKESRLEYVDRSGNEKFLDIYCYGFLDAYGNHHLNLIYAIKGGVFNPTYVLTNECTAEEVSNEQCNHDIPQQIQIDSKGNLYVLIKYHTDAVLLRLNHMPLSMTPEISVSPHDLYFITKDLSGKSGLEKSITISNLGNTDLEIEKIIDTPHFSITGLPESLKLGSGEHFTFIVKYTPKGSLSSDEYIRILSNDPERPELKLLATGKVLQEKTENKKVTGGGCLIATAAFGSEMAPQVQQLRETRDNIVMKTQSGAAFMTGFNLAYYSFAPTVADWENQNPVFKEIVKTTITPLITTLSILNYVDIDSEAEMLGYGIGVILLNIGMYFVAPAFVILRLKQRKN